MDKTAIKNFAVWARKKLIEDIKQKAYELGITGKEIKEPEVSASDTMLIGNRSLNKAEIEQRKSLVARIKEKGFDYVIEEVAYTWFNRILALRFMEVNEYLPSGIRVLSSAEPGRKEPDIVKEAFNAGLDLDMELVHTLKDSNDTETLYRYLLVKQCNALNEILPGLFEKIEDYIEILLPSNLLAEGFVIRQLADSIPEEYFKDQVEIIGWMYQYYISEKKDEVFEGLKKNIKITGENIAAATQLFTPEWIVKYMVENSLGRLWLEGHPNEELKGRWKYYLEEAGQESDVQEHMEEIRLKSRDLRPEDIKFLDPAMGSGHILVYAFDVLYDIYKSAGYSERDIPGLILENNLYGLDIDSRAVQLAYFAVMMKARSKSRRIFREKVNVNLCAIQESNDFPNEAVNYLVSPDETELENRMHREDAEYLINVFHDAREFGSVLEVKPVDFDAVEMRLEEIRNGEAKDLPGYQYRSIILGKMPALIKQARIMSRKFDVVCTNPPYMRNGNMNLKLLNYLKKNYSNSKDLYAVFMEKGLEMCNTGAYLSMITQQSWMFLSSFGRFREKIFESCILYSMLHLGPRTFEEISGEVVQSASFVLRKASCINYRSNFVRLIEFNNAREKEARYLQVLDKDSQGMVYNASLAEFLKIEGRPLSYWVSKKTRDIFSKSERIGNYGSPRRALQTGNSERFVRYWFEVNACRTGFGLKSREEALSSGFKWFLFNNGGTYRKWAGNIIHVVDWENNGFNIKSTGKAIIPGERYYFENCIYWNKVSTGKMSVKYQSHGIIPGDASPCFFSENEFNLIYIMGLLNSKVADIFFEILSPALNFQTGDVSRIPVIFCGSGNQNSIRELVMSNIDISKRENDSFELSWGFKKHPLLEMKSGSGLIRKIFEEWSVYREKEFYRLKSNEEKLNQIFIDIYGLQKELKPEISDNDVTIRKAERERDIKSLISYAVGCMFGRYSIDAEGLVYAGGSFEDKWIYNNGHWKVRKTVKDEEGNVVEDAWIDASFAPCADNILPITDDEYFEDDIVQRFIEFLRAAFGEDTLEENLDYIAGATGRKPSETARQAIRRYFIRGFYADHVQAYQKRPIYWLFDSGRQDGFKALIYMHRYDEFTVARVRTDYLHKLQKAYESEITRLNIIIDSDVSQREKTNARKRKEQILKQMEECLQYDQIIAHAANQRVTIDLDEGVIANHARFQGVEIPQGEGRKPLKADLLAKI